MKKYKLSIVLIVLIIVALLYNLFKKNIDTNQLVKHESVEQSITNEEKSIIKIYIYNVSDDKVEEREISVNNKNLIDYDEYVKLVLENSKFINEDMKLLAVYNLESGDIVIKLSEEFKKLSNTTLKNLQDSITKTLKIAFPSIGNVIIQVDTNI